MEGGSEGLITVDGWTEGVTVVVWGGRGTEGVKEE